MPVHFRASQPRRLLFRRPAASATGRSADKWRATAAGIPNGTVLPGSGRAAGGLADHRTTRFQRRERNADE
ncbi:hypothetical protein GCM10010389_31290 [Streptomyces echinoruber]|uniref:Uncharacterized protein n=1 Tax=Streptomyces echinoruber TaxID=68898 RepID=A0A918VDS6_9ACTN|nr:hypothetical protein GCM10010389_31290 [Streptomyces echinoruber]